MNTLGLSILVQKGCCCWKEKISVNNHRYAIIKQITEGGFSSIYLVEDSVRTRYVMKKIICHSREDQESAIKEIHITNMFKHNHIIQLIDTEVKGTADIVLNLTSEVYLIMPYFDRGTLSDYLEYCSRQLITLELWQVCDIFYKICLGVQIMHGSKPEPIAHRDLKTANICLTVDYQPVIIDFGSASNARVKICGSQEAQGVQDLAAEHCSMTYRAPELFNVESYCMLDERVDIWSLGCILYALCYYKSPFDPVYERGDSVALAVLSGNINFPESSNPYPEEIQELIKFMLVVDPNERPFIDDVLRKSSSIFQKYQNDHHV